MDVELEAKKRNYIPLNLAEGLASLSMHPTILCGHKLHMACRDNWRNAPHLRACSVAYRPVCVRHGKLAVISLPVGLSPSCHTVTILHSSPSDMRPNNATPSHDHLKTRNSSNGSIGVCNNSSTSNQLASQLAS
jgi:hypothetical protein